MTGRRGGLALVGLVGLFVLATASTAILTRPSAGQALPLETPSLAVAATPVPSAKTSTTRYLLVIDFIAYAAEAIANDPAAGSPDAEDLIPVLGDPTAFGVEITDLVDDADDTNSRCGETDASTLDALARALNANLPSDQQIDPDATETRSLLHWDAAEGYASLRIFAQGPVGSPTCADAGTRF